MPVPALAAKEHKNMETLGERLQQIRKEKGISLEEIAHITKIKITSLQALEDDDYQSLPSEVYTKSFIKIYASYLGLDGNEFVREYLESLPVQKGKPKKIFAIQQPVTVQRRNTSPKNRRFPVGMVLLILIIVLGGVGGFMYFKKTQDKQGGFLSFLNKQENASNPAAGVSGAASAPAVMQGDYIALSNVPAGTSQVLRVEASSSVWLSVAVSGKTVFEGLVGAGAREQWAFTDSLSIKISEPDSVSVFLGDKPIAFDATGVTTLLADAKGIRIESGQ